MGVLSSNNINSIHSDSSLGLCRKVRLKLGPRLIQMRLKIRRLLRSFLPVSELRNRPKSNHKHNN